MHKRALISLTAERVSLLARKYPFYDTIATFSDIGANYPFPLAHYASHPTDEIRLPSALVSLRKTNLQ